MEDQTWTLVWWLVGAVTGLLSLLAVGFAVYVKGQISELWRQFNEYRVMSDARMGSIEKEIVTDNTLYRELDRK